MRRGLLALLLVGALPASAGPALVIYRCVAADGAVTLQNGTKCAKGMQQQKRVMDTPTAPASLPVPARVAPPGAVVSMPGAVGAAGAVADKSTTLRDASTGAATTMTTPTGASGTPATRLPPPMLYACLTRDAQRYYSETAESSRCAPLEAVGLDGRSAAPAQACETVQDRCEPVTEAERCAAWAERRRVAEQALTFSPEQIDAARAEIEHVDGAVAGTACGG